MFVSKSLLFACALSLSKGQSVFHTSHGGGSYTSISHGAPSTGQVYKTVPVKQPAFTQQTYSQPRIQQTSYQQPTTYQQPATTYSKPVTTYSKPATTYSQPSTYQQPTAYQQRPTTYNRPHAVASAPTYGEKCSLDYQEKYIEICTPSLEKECTQDTVKNGVSLTEEYDCYPVTKTVCTEFEDLELTEVCAVSYTLQEVPSEAQLVEVKWEKVCHEEVICINPHSAGAYHASAYCKEQIKNVCMVSPAVYPVNRPVVLKLPQPYDTCITKEIILPRIKCQQITTKKCATKLRVEDNDELPTDKCTTGLGQELCQQSTLKLPRQACLEKFTQTKVVYEEQEQSGYNSSRY